MRIAVTGHEGQVARSIMERASTRENVSLVAIGRPELDLAQPEMIKSALAGAQADLIVSAAAYTAVDQAEDQPELAHVINAEGAGAVAAAAAELGVPVIHLSTDYVFDGKSKQPYREDDQPAPLGIYGASKLAGEKAVADANPHHIILRTAWVYSPFGKNFIKTMLRLAADCDEIAVVADQWGNPTSALDIADAILHIASRLQASGEERWGIYHLTGRGAVNWADFARYVFDTSSAHGGPHARVRDIATSDYPTKAHRPANSQLSNEKLAAAFGYAMPQWQESTRATVQRLV